MVIIKDSKVTTNNFSGILYFTCFDGTSSKVFYKKSKLHRYYGPAEISINLFKKEYWYYEGKFFGNYYMHYSNAKFKKDLNSWLL